MAEPALASIIQEDIGANPGHRRRGRHGTFSFDVANGGCGVLSAAHLVDALVGPGSARLGMIVAGDVDPSPRTSRGFPFAGSAGAVLLSHRDDDELGFQRFEFHTFPEDAALFEARLHFEPGSGRLLARRGRNVLDVHVSDDYAGRCLEHAARVAAAFLGRAGVDPADVDLLITSQYPPGFSGGLARKLGVPLARVPDVRGDLATAHTAGPIAALDSAIGSGSFARARHVVFVAVGAGITVAVAHYQRA